MDGFFLYFFSHSSIISNDWTFVVTSIQHESNQNIIDRIDKYKLDEKQKKKWKIFFPKQEKKKMNQINDNQVKIEK